MSEYPQLIIYLRFLILHENMQSAQTIQYTNMEKCSSHQIIIEQLFRKYTAKHSPTKKKANDQPTFAI